MAMKRTLILDEDDLIMVVKSDIVKQIDNNRGEMNRTEFVNYLIQCQLAGSEYITQESLTKLTEEFKQFLRGFLQFFITYEMADKREPGPIYHDLHQQKALLENLGKPGKQNLASASGLPTIDPTLLDY